MQTIQQPTLTPFANFTRVLLLALILFGILISSLTSQTALMFILKINGHFKSIEHYIYIVEYLSMTIGAVVTTVLMKSMVSEKE